MKLSNLNVHAAKIPDSGDYNLTDGTHNIPIKYKKGESSDLVILFHGAIDRKIRKIPKFQTLLPLGSSAHQISIFDATLTINDTLQAAWYAGSENFALQTILPNLITALSKRIGVTRRIYVGGSSGGFAALFYSWADRNSLCITINPQTTIERYIPRVKNAYFDSAWPCAAAVAEIEEKCTIDLPSLYKDGFENTVIYLQSAGDMRHFSEQMPPFLVAALQYPERFILECSYWGIPNHSASIPPKHYLSWVKAAILSSTWGRQELLDTYHTLVGQDGDTETTPPYQKTQSNSGHDTRDIKRADLLRDQQLRR